MVSTRVFNKQLINMQNPLRPDLKIKKFSNPEKTFVTKRYVIENEKDLKKTLKSFPQLDNNFMGVAANWEKALNEGRIILVSDESWAGFPTYCFESDQNSTHPSSLIRVK